MNFAHVTAAHVRGQFLGLRSAFPFYRQESTRSSIVMTEYIAGQTGSAGLLSYPTSKHAVVGLERAAAIHGGPLGIRVDVDVDVDDVRYGKEWRR